MHFAPDDFEHGMVSEADSGSLAWKTSLFEYKTSQDDGNRRTSPPPPLPHPHTDSPL